jgi:hypothetical protein
MNLPVEIWFNIFKDISLIELSKLMCVNRYLYKLISYNKWKFIDNLNDISFELIPKNKETFRNFKYSIDWVGIILKNKSNKLYIPNYVIEWIDDKQILEYMCIYQTFSETTIRKLFDKINWRLLLIYQKKIPLDLITYIVETYDLSVENWNLVWLNENLDLDFITKYIDNVKWHIISSNKEIVSFSLIEKYGDRLILQELTKHGINENIVIYYLSKMDIICWTNVSQFTKLSMEFIKTHIDKLNLQFILNYQTIDETFLEQLIETISDFDKQMFFQSVALNQKISYSFILKYKNDLYIKNLIRNKHILRNDLFMIYK